MARTIAFRRHLRAEINAANGAYLFSEDGVIAIRGAQAAAVAALLDGTRDLEELLDHRPDGMDPTQVTGLLAELVEADLVTVRDPAERELDDRALAYWDACGVGARNVATRTAQASVALVSVGSGVDTASVEHALHGAALDVRSGDADLSIVLCDDYLDPRLGDIDAEHRRTGRPWLLAKPAGAQVWLGPVMQPGDSGCWHCLTHRLWNHRHAEACVQAELGHVGPAARPLSAVPPLTSAAAHLIALEASKWLAGYRYQGQQCVWLLDTLDLQGTLHELRRRPQCPQCGDPSLVAGQAQQPVVLHQAEKASRGGGGYRTMTPGQVLDRYRHLIGPVTGIVKQIQRDRHAPAFVNAYRSGPNIVRNTTGFTGLLTNLRCENGGKGVTPLDAEVGALCEAVERYSGTYQGDEARVSGSLRSLGDEAIHPNTCMLFDERQYRSRAAWNREHAPFQHVCTPFEENAEMDWTPLWSLTEQRHRLLPTAMLYFGAPQATASVRADSNGNAAGSSIEDAILQGTLELVERDAVALWWYNRAQVPGVDLAAFGDPWVDDMRRQYGGIGRDLWALDITSDLGVPVTVALSRQIGGDQERIMMGFGAHLDPRLALRRAIAELNQMLPAVLADPDDLDDPDTATWLRHATVANQPYLRPRAGIRARIPMDAGFAYRSDVREDVQALVRALSAQDMDLLVLDQTRPDIGLPVVKVVVPGLRPFWSRFAPGRLFDVPVRLGRLTEPTPYHRLNPFPMFL